MNKTLILLTVSTLMFAFIFTSCNNSAKDPAKENARIDSIVNSRLDSVKAEMQKECNDMVMAEAKLKADSMMNSMKKSSSKGSTTTTKTQEKKSTAPVIEKKVTVPVINPGVKQLPKTPK